MRFFSDRPVFLLLLLILLTSCGPNTTTVEPMEEAQADPAEQPGNTENKSAVEEERADENDALATLDKDKKDTPEPVFPALQPGDYCYAADTEDETVYVRLAIDSADRVTGDLQGSVHNEKEGYYTSYRQSLDGTIDGSNLNLDVATWIEYDRQNSQETWKVSDRDLQATDNTLSKESCAVVNKVFQNEDGLEASDLTSGANRIKTEEVYFDAGKSSTTVSDSVVRGDRDVYVLSAQGGQQMYLTITSLEDNAEFDVVSPSGMILGTNVTDDKFFLPNTGEYQVIVGSTRGNATYDLVIGIE